jgi:hypothetical protein
MKMTLGVKRRHGEALARGPFLLSSGRTWEMAREAKTLAVNVMQWRLKA